METISPWVPIEGTDEELFLETVTKDVHGWGKRMFRKIAIVFMATYVVAWLCLYALAMDGNPQDLAANFVDYVRLSWTPGAGELVAFIQFGALAIAGVVALVVLPGWRALRTFWRRSRA